MSKRQEIREQRRRSRMRNRIIIIALIVVGVLLVVYAVINSTLRPPVNQGTSTVVVTPITPRALNVPMSGTSMGDPNAPVKMDVWEDFQCSGCLFYTNTLEPQIIQSYVETSKVYYTFHFIPFIDGTSGESHQAANAAMCANEQGRFWDYHDMLFANWQGENVGAYIDVRLVAFANQLGLDMTKFEKYFKANTYADQINQDAQAGQAKGVPPTPGIFVNGVIVTSPRGATLIPSFDEISTVIEAALKGH